jgi:hypothetical protein
MPPCGVRSRDLQVRDRTPDHLRQHTPRWAPPTASSKGSTRVAVHLAPAHDGYFEWMATENAPSGIEGLTAEIFYDVVMETTGKAPSS